MTDLFIEDVHHLNAAKGWVELGNHVEAFNELEKIAPRNRASVEVLEVRWQIYTLAGKHDAALTIAEALVNGTPKRYQGWIWRSHSLNELGRSREAVHVLLNPLPVYGLGIGILALGAALVSRSRPAQVIALGIIVVSTASSWPVQYYGENAYQHVRQISDEQGRQWLDEHMERAERFIYIFYATALLGIAALISQRKFPKAVIPLTLATLVASIVALGFDVWISKAGGQIRHPEFRIGSAPSTKPAAHDHDQTQPSHEKMHPPDTTGVHKHEAAPKQTAEKMPLPDSLEGTWKTIHEHHGQLESAITAKKFSDVASHADHLVALVKRLVELAHPDHKPVVQGGANKINVALAELKQSAETGSELVMKNNFKQFGDALTELDQQMKKH